jgi:hypothetical protein
VNAETAAIESVAPEPLIPESVERFRDEYRSAEIPPGYRPVLHLLFTFGGGSAALLACLWQLRAVAPLEWLTIPLTFLYANLAEYFGHRFPMHNPVRGLKLVYKRHAGQHHRFFSHLAMPLESPRDLRAVLFPPVLVIFFFGAFGGPVALLLAWAASSNVAWLFLATALGYFLNYEILHTLHHAPAGSWVARQRWHAALSRRHREHHDPAEMTRVNFNITYPVGDWLFGTLKR